MTILVPALVISVVQVLLFLLVSGLVSLWSMARPARSSWGPLWHTAVLIGSLIGLSWVLGQWWTSWLDNRGVDSPGVVAATILIGTVLGVLGPKNPRTAVGRFAEWSAPLLGLASGIITGLALVALNDNGIPPRDAQLILLGFMLLIFAIPVRFGSAKEDPEQIPTDEVPNPERLHKVASTFDGEPVAMPTWTLIRIGGNRTSIQLLYRETPELGSNYVVVSVQYDTTWEPGSEDSSVISVDLPNVDPDEPTRIQITRGLKERVRYRITPSTIVVFGCRGMDEHYIRQVVQRLKPVSITDFLQYH